MIEHLFSGTLSIIQYDTDDDYNTLIKDQCRIEKELKYINNELYIAKHYKRDMETVFIISDNSLPYFDDINTMINKSFGSGKYSCNKSVESIPFSKTIQTSKGNRQTVIIKRKTFVNLPKNIYIKLIFIIILILVIVYIIYLFIYKFYLF